MYRSARSLGRCMYTKQSCQGTTCGYFWSELLQSVVTITNSCDRAGTIANELPVTEQIPVSAGLVLKQNFSGIQAAFENGLDGEVI